MFGHFWQSFTQTAPSLTLPRNGGGNVTRSVFFPSPKMGEGQGGGISSLDLSNGALSC